MEGDVGLRETTVLRGAEATDEGPHGAAPGLPLPAAAQAPLHRVNEATAASPSQPSSST